MLVPWHSEILSLNVCLISNVRWCMGELLIACSVAGCSEGLVSKVKPVRSIQSAQESICDAGECSSRLYCGQRQDLGKEHLT